MRFLVNWGWALETSAESNTCGSRFWASWRTKTLTFSLSRRLGWSQETSSRFRNTTPLGLTDSRVVEGSGGGGSFCERSATLEAAGVLTVHGFGFLNIYLIFCTSSRDFEVGDYKGIFTGDVLTFVTKNLFCHRWWGTLSRNNSLAFQFSLASPAGRTCLISLRIQILSWTSVRTHYCNCHPNIILYFRNMGEPLGQSPSSRERIKWGLLASFN